MTARAAVADIQYELRPLDSQGLGGEVGIVRDLSDERSLSLNVESYRLEYDRSDLSAPIDTHKAYFAIDSRNARGNTNLKIGSNRFESAGNEGDGLFLDLGIDRQLSPNSRMLVSLGSSYETNGDLFRSINDFGRQTGIVGSPADEGVDAQDLDEVLQRDFASVAFSYSRARTSVSASINWQDQDYESSNTFDRQVIGLRGTIARELTPRLSVSGFVSLSDLDYEVDSRQDEDVSIGVGIDYTAGKRLSIQLINRTIMIGIPIHQVLRTTSCVEFFLCTIVFSIQRHSVLPPPANDLSKLLSKTCQRMNSQDPRIRQNHCRGCNVDALASMS